MSNLEPFPLPPSWVSGPADAWCEGWDINQSKEQYCGSLHPPPEAPSQGILELGCSYSLAAEARNAGTRTAQPVAVSRPLSCLSHAVLWRKHAAENAANGFKLR